MIKKSETDRSIKDDYFGNLGSMTDEALKWWKGLGRELEVDIETLQE